MNAIDVDSVSGLSGSGEENSEGPDFDGDLQDDGASYHDYLGDDDEFDEGERGVVSVGATTALLQYLGCHFWVPGPQNP